MVISIKAWSNTSRAAVEREACSESDQCKPYLLATAVRSNYDGIAKEAPDNSIESLDLAQFWARSCH